MSGKEVREEPHGRQSTSPMPTSGSVHDFVTLPFRRDFFFLLPGALQEKEIQAERCTEKRKLSSPEWA